MAAPKSLEEQLTGMKRLTAEYQKLLRLYLVEMTDLRRQLAEARGKPPSTLRSPSPPRVAPHSAGKQPGTPRKRKPYVYRDAPRDVNPKNPLVRGKRRRESPERFVARPARCHQRRSKPPPIEVIVID